MPLGVLPTLRPFTIEQTAAGPLTLSSRPWSVLVVNQAVAAPFTVLLPPTPPKNTIVQVKDGKGDAATNTITIDGNGQTIDGGATTTITTDYGAVYLGYDGTEWRLLASAGAGGGGGGLNSITVTQAVTVGANNVAVYFDGALWRLADASNQNKLGLGVVIDYTAAGGNETFTVVFSGVITLVTNPPAPLTPGQYYFTSPTTPGLLTTTEPSTPGQFSNPLLFALSASEGVVLPFRPSALGGSVSSPYPSIISPPSVASLAWVNQGTATAADDATAGFDIIATGQAGNSRHLLVETIANPAGGWTFDMGLIFTPSRQSTPLAGVAIYSTATTKLVEFDLYFDGSSMLCQFSRLDSPTAVVGSAYQAPFSVLVGLFLGPFFLRLQSDGTNLSPSYSNDGVNWQSAGASQPLAGYFGADLPNCAGVCIDGPGNVGAIPKAHVFHWSLT